MSHSAAFQTVGGRGQHARHHPEAGLGVPQPRPRSAHDGHRAQGPVLPHQGEEGLLRRRGLHAGGARHQLLLVQQLEHQAEAGHVQPDRADVQLSGLQWPPLAVRSQLSGLIHTAQRKLKQLSICLGSLVDQERSLAYDVETVTALDQTGENHQPRFAVLWKF